jgi:hypothetical protein
MQEIMESQPDAAHRNGPKVGVGGYFNRIRAYQFGWRNQASCLSFPGWEQQSPVGMRVHAHEFDERILLPWLPLA